MIKWEYWHKAYYPSQQFAYDLDAMGEEGWELVAVVLNPNSYVSVFFKRQKINHEGDSSKEITEGSQAAGEHEVIQ